MSWRLAESLKTLRTQINALYPNRDKSSDGSIGDTKHSNRKSDHNPNAAGVVTAIDIDADLSDTVNVGVIVNALRASNDPRIKYIIWKGQITMPGDLSRLKKYTGPNGHFHHAHISVSSNKALYDDKREWRLDGTVADVPNVPSPVRDLKQGDKGDDVKALQTALGINADGDFGKNTKATVITFQRKHGLDADGIVGKDTRQKLGI